jgi:hypothetical protein
MNDTEFKLVRINWHGFKRAGGLMLGVSLSYPWNIGGHAYWHGALHLIVVTIRVSVKQKNKYEQNRKKKM